MHSLAAHGHWWDWTAPWLASRARVVALDFRGHGRSAAAPSYAFDDYAADVVAVLDALGWGAAVLVGHSLGGYVGALTAARHPARVSALVAADVMTWWTDELAARARAQAERASPRFGSRSEAGTRFRLAPPDTRAPGAWLAHLGEAGAVERGPGHWSPAVDRRVFLHPPIDPWPFLGAIRCPTLVLRGTESTLMSRDAAWRMAAAIPVGVAAELAGASHHLILDDPRGFSRLVTAWLDDLGPVEPRGGLPASNAPSP